MRDRITGEPIIAQLSHSSRVYEADYRFPLGHIWIHPGVAWSALREVMPWEALVLSAFVLAASWLSLGRDLGTTIGVSAALGLVTFQMLRTRTFLTPSRIVRQRGLLLLTRTEIPLSTILDARVEYPVVNTRSFGDVVLATPGGEQRLRAIGDPSSVLTQILYLRASGSSEA